MRASLSMCFFCCRDGLVGHACWWAVLPCWEGVLTRSMPSCPLFFFSQQNNIYYVFMYIIYTTYYYSTVITYILDTWHYLTPPKEKKTTDNNPPVITRALACSGSPLLNRQQFCSYSLKRLGSLHSSALLPSFWQHSSQAPWVTSQLRTPSCSGAWAVLSWY